MPELPFVHIHAELIGIGNFCSICFRVVVADQRNQIVNGNHLVRTRFISPGPAPP